MAEDVVAVVVVAAAVTDAIDCRPAPPPPLPAAADTDDDAIATPADDATAEELAPDPAAGAKPSSCTDVGAAAALSWLLLLFMTNALFGLDPLMTIDDE